MRPSNATTPPSTGHAPFDRAMQAAFLGNVFGSTQTSAYIRPHPLMQDADLADFRKVYGLSTEVERAIREALGERTGILYCFLSGQPRAVHGWLLSQIGSGLYETLGAWATGPGPESARIIAVMEDWLTNPRGTRARAEAAVSAAAEALAGLDNAEVDAVLAVAVEAEAAKPTVGAWLVLSDVVENNRGGLPPGLEPFEGRLDAIEAEDRNAFVRARRAIGSVLDEMYAATFPAGAHVEAPAAMHLVSGLAAAYPARDAAPRP